MTSPSFYSQAGNFISSVQGGVDPRTGLFNLSLPLANIHSGWLAGPVLALSLQYSPLSSVNEGFGTGFTLNLTRYDTDTGKLLLSTGEEYRVSSSGDTVKQKKLKNFIFEKKGEGTCRVIHKSGLVETLSLIGTVYVPTGITAPDGRGLELVWNAAYKPARLARVTEDDGAILCSVTYPDESVATTQFSLLPYDGNAGYSTVFKFTNELLVRVTSHADAPALVWTFDYDDVGPQKNYRTLTGLTSPTGLTEKVAYYSDNGMEFPDIAGLPALPCVYQHTLIPGGEQPESITRWTWTQKNYLGHEAGLNQWQPDTDGMLNILLSDYQYGSTAERIDTDGRSVLSKVTRRYNSYHLQVSETTVRDGKTYSQATEYYAKPGVAFNDQPAQYALPVSQTESWEDTSGASPRTRVIFTEFDEAGNPLYQETPDGTVTKYEYYPADGEGNNCPADPYGFTRWLKSRTVTPRQVKGDEPVTRIVSTWRKLNALCGEGYIVVADSVTQTTGNASTVVTREYYDDISDMLTYAREKTRNTVLTPDVSEDKTFSSSRVFTYEAGTGISCLRQTDTFIGHDTLTAARATIRHAHTGLLLSETDVQDVTITHSYDKARRPLSRTIAPETDYENTTTWSYVIEDDGPVTTVTDASGNQQKTHVDGAGRRIRQQRLDMDDTQQWFEVSSRAHNPLGEVASGTGSDWHTGAGEQYSLDMTASYDGWGTNSLLAFTDGIQHVHNTDPVGLTRTTHIQGENDGEALRGVTLITSYDERSWLPLRESRCGIAGESLTRTLEWDGLGRLRGETDEAGHKTEWTYDAFRRVLTQTLPDGSTVTRTYAPHLTGNQVASISVTGKNRRGKMQTWHMGTQTFDSLGRVTERVSGGRVTTYAYEGAYPVPVSVTEPSGKTLTYTYIPELGNRISSLTTDDVTQTFSYDRLTGDLLTAKEGSTQNSNTWTPSGSLKAESFTQENTTRTSAYTHTLAGGVVAYTDITGKKTTYERDTFGRVVGISDDALTVSLTYDALGRLSSQTVTDRAAKATLTTALEYDDFGREITRTVTDSTGVTLAIAQTWTENDLLASRSTQQNANSVREEKYTYDTRNRLVKYEASGSSLPVDADGHEMTLQRYEYDALNNLYGMETIYPDDNNDYWATYFYDNPDDPTQLTSVSSNMHPQTLVLEYDADGRMTQDEAGRTLGYDVTGRLVSVNGNDISGGSYGYDALNRLVSQNVSEGDTRQLFYRADELINEVLVQQAREARLIKAGHACLGVSDGSTLTLTAGDHHDSLLWSRGTEQKEGTQHVWSPYGNGSPTDGLPGFNGERTDPVSGTYHLGNGYRAYNPVLMRFNCPDSLSPFGAGGINPYAYCAGDPVNHTDPSGHISWQGILGIVTGSLGLAFSIFTAGASIAAAGGVMAAVGAASTTSLVVGGLGLVADATAIASGAEEGHNPRASAILGWVSMAFGLAGLSFGGGQSIRWLLRREGQDIHSLPLPHRAQAFSVMAAFDDENNMIYRADSGLIHNFRGSSELLLMVHGSQDGEHFIYTRTTGVEFSEQSDTYFFDVQQAKVGPQQLVELLRDNHGIDLYSVRGFLNLLSCGSGGDYGTAQQLASILGRPVRAWGDRYTTLSVGNINDLFWGRDTTISAVNFDGTETIADSRIYYPINRSIRRISNVSLNEGSFGMRV
ncbi:RHS repeat-associated core domain-containing protein [Raoultella terrigena]|uniref:RHS repeat-associated core domain-containing protein n=1 Tax=Raoultella terrigena TaxID=577 RepID=UPI0011D27B75|nr:RHS repeat-associated core domain-containing protein [Raoultella terrigena]